jgi:outer membrane protein assembly factor BamB
MPIPIQCEQCGKPMQVPERMAGKKGKCPACGGLIEIPAAPPAASPGSAPPSSPATAAPASATACREHGGKAVGTCGACGGALCLECRKAYGYFCSAACRDKARANRPSAAEAEERAAAKAMTQKAEVLMAHGRKIAIGAVAVGVVLLLLWILPTLRSRVAWEAASEQPYLSGIGGDDGVFAVTGDRKIAAIDPASGAARWTVDAPGGAGDKRFEFFGPPLVLRRVGPRLLCAGPGGLTAFDAATGTVAWKGPAAAADRFGAFLHDDATRLVTGDGIVVLAGEDGPVCLDAATGKVRWSGGAREGDTEPGPKTPALRPQLIALACDAGRIYAVTAPASLECRAAKDGARLWSWIPAGGSGAGMAGVGRVGLLPIAGGVVVSHGRKATCLDAQGKVRWSVEGGAPDEYNWGTSLAAASGRVLFHAYGVTMLVDPATGKEAWRQSFGNDIEVAWSDAQTILVTCSGDAGPSVQASGGVGGAIQYAGTLRGGISTGSGQTLAALRAADGKGIWSANGLGGQVLVDGGTAYAIAQEGKVALLDPTEDHFKSQMFVAAVDLATGAARWRWERLRAHAFGALAGGRLLLVGSVSGEKKDAKPTGFVAALSR